MISNIPYLDIPSLFIYYYISVEISDAGRHEMVDDDVSKQKNDISFGLGELERQTDEVRLHS